MEYHFDTAPYISTSFWLRRSWRTSVLADDPCDPQDDPCDPQGCAALTAAPDLGPSWTPWTNWHEERVSSWVGLKLPGEFETSFADITTRYLPGPGESPAARTLIPGSVEVPKNEEGRGPSRFGAIGDHLRPHPPIGAYPAYWDPFRYPEAPQRYQSYDERRLEGFPTSSSSAPRGRISESGGDLNARHNNHGSRGEASGGAGRGGEERPRDTTWFLLSSNSILLKSSIHLAYINPNACLNPFLFPTSLLVTNYRVNNYVPPLNLSHVGLQGQYSDPPTGSSGVQNNSPSQSYASHEGLQSKDQQSAPPIPFCDEDFPPL